MDILKKLQSLNLDNKQIEGVLEGFLAHNKEDEVTGDKYPTKSTGFFEVKNTDKGTKYIAQYNEYAYYVKDEKKFISFNDYDYIYNDDYYKPITKLNFLHVCDLDTKDKASDIHLEKFYKKAKIKCYKDRESMKMPDKMINLKNGILQIKKKKLIKHSPDYFFQYKLKHDYDPSAKCPKFMDFLDEVFMGDPELVQATSEIFGYTLVGGKPWLHTAFVLYGSGRNGKSTWLEILKELLGEKNYSAISMGKIDREFSAIRLDGKLANIVEETPNKQIDPEVFKNIVGGGQIGVARKHHDEFDMTVNARMFFACNKLPKFGDQTVANYERLFIMPFNRYFPEKTRNFFKSDELKKEMSGIVNFALAGIDAVSEFGTMIKPKSVDSLIEEYREEADSVYAWYTESVEVDVSSDIFFESKKIFTRYINYCDEVKIKNHVGYNAFCKRIKGLIENDINDAQSNDYNKISCSVKRSGKRGFKHIKSY